MVKYERIKGRLKKIAGAKEKRRIKFFRVKQRYTLIDNWSFKVSLSFSILF